jgi:hypothetical protein
MASYGGRYERRRGDGRSGEVCRGQVGVAEVRLGEVGFAKSMRSRLARVQFALRGRWFGAGVGIEHRIV